MIDEPQSHASEASSDERWNALAELDGWLRVPMLVLSFVWLLLVVVELVWGTFDVLETFGTAIWITFLIEFAIRLALAPEKAVFLSRNWLTIIALVVPAFRLFRAFRILRVARAARSLRLVRIVGTANRGMNALRAGLSRRGLGYVTGLAMLVALLGAGGMLAFEPASQVEGGFEGYAEALWWTGMLLATMGSEFWPRTPEGRILCFLLALYGFAVFGYITASFASFFVGRDAASEQGEVAGRRRSQLSGQSSLPCAGTSRTEYRLPICPRTRARGHMNLSSRPRLGCLWGTLSSSRRQIRSTRFLFTTHPRSVLGER